jgi:hypothetical protein
MKTNYIIQKFVKGAWVALSIPMTVRQADARMAVLRKAHPEDRIRAVAQ